MKVGVKMGYDATIYISKGNKQDIQEHFLMLNYLKYGDSFYLGNTNEYLYEAGVSARVEENNDLVYKLRIHLRSQIWANSYDIEAMNKTLRYFRKWFNAYFISDAGKNKYFKKELEKISSLENGCYLAVSNLQNEFANLKMCIERFPVNDESSRILLNYGTPTPSIINANVYLSLLCSIIENYYKETYLVLLKYSKNKESILKTGSKLSAYDLSEISKGVLTVEQAFTNTLSFQNIYKICHNFNVLDKKLDISSALKKPYKKYKENLFDAAHRILEHRHRMIHRLDYDISYNSELIKKDIERVEEIIFRSYKYICQVYNWNVRIDYI